MVYLRLYDIPVLKVSWSFQNTITPTSTKCSREQWKTTIWCVMFMCAAAKELKIGYMTSFIYLLFPSVFASLNELTAFESVKSVILILREARIKTHIVGMQLKHFISWIKLNIVERKLFIFFLLNIELMGFIISIQFHFFTFLTFLISNFYSHSKFMSNGNFNLERRWFTLQYSRLYVRHKHKVYQKKKKRSEK